MPMDNNDNCYPGLSEENSKITSVLHPYDLPKFDFDHSHIRFDSLAENEGFLGISSREEDNWIEDFSRGNSGIEFGTSAAECCSLPRHVDVWSEATSSESVEMLLKSVGQEEILPGESVIEEYNECDELSTLEKQMEVNPSPAGIRKDQDSDLEAPKVQPSNNSSGLNEGSEDVDIDPTCPSFTQGEQSASGCSVNLESSLDVRESNPQNKDGCHTKPSTSLDESSDYKIKRTLVLATQRCSDSPLQNVMGDVEFLNGQDRASANPLENENNESTQNNACNANDTGVCGIPDIIHQSISELSVFVAPNVAATQDFEEPSSIATKEESSLPTRGNSQDLPCAESSVNSKDLALTGSLEIKYFTDICEKSVAGSEGDLIVNKQTALSNGVESLEIKHSIDICEKSIGGSEGDLRVDKQAASSSGVKARGVDIKCEQLKDVLSPTSHAESSVEYKECSQGSSIQVDKGVSSITSEGYIPGTEHELGIHIIVDPVNQVDNLPVLSDAQQFVDEHAAENLGERNRARQNHEDTVLSSVSSEIVISAEDTSQSVAEHVTENLIKRNDDTDLPSVSSKTVMLVEAASSGKEDPGDVSPKPVILDKDEARLATSSLAEEVERKIYMDQTLESDLASTLKSESNIGSNGSNAASPETSHGTTDYIGEQNGELNLIERNDTIENHEVTVLSSVSSEIVMSVEAASSGKEDPGDVSPNPVILDSDEARSSLAEEVERKTDMEQTLESDLPSTLKSESNIGSNGSNAASHEMSPGTTDYMGEQNGELNLIKRNDAIENHEIAVLSSVSSEIVMQVEAASAGKEDPGDVSPNPVILDNDEARSSLAEEVERKIDVEQTLESDLPSTLKSESNIGSNGSNAASHETSRGTSDYMGEQNEELNLPSDLEPGHLDKIADTVTDAMLEEKTPSLKFPSQVDGNVPVEEEILKDSSLPLTGTLDAASLNEGVMVHTKVALRFSDAMDVDGVPCDSNVVVADCPEAVLVVKHMQTKIGNCFQPELSENSGGGCLAEADKLSHTTASVTSCSKLSEPDERMKEDHIESAAQHLSESTLKAGEVPSVSKKDGPSEGSREERSFSFDVPPVAVKESGSMPSGSRKNRGGRKVPQVTSTVTEGGSASIGAKTTSDRKTRRGSAKSTKNNAKGNNVKQTEDNTSCTLVSYSGPAQFIQFSAGLAESRKLTTPIPSSNLPDLNTAAICHQPFTDLQQLQLRAQIFVYGSLIQGTAPDEGCMASAFGASDGGRTSWEPRWRAFIERIHSQNTVSNNFSTPVQSHLDSKGQHKSSKQSAPRSEVVQSPVSNFCKKETPVNVKSMVPLSSPPWNLSAPSSDGLPLRNVVRGAHLSLPSLHPCQTAPARTIGGQTSWLSPAPIPGPWVPSSRSSAFDLSARYSSSSSAEAVKVTLPSDSSLAISNSMNPFNALVSHLGGSSNLVQDSSMQKLTSSPVGSKSRKRRKSNTTEESPQTSFLATLAVPHSDAIISNLSKKSPAVAHLSSIYSNPSTSPIEGHFSTTVAVTGSPVVTVNPIHRELHMEKNSAHMGELKQVEKAKLDGEEAMAHAADLVSRCQDVWSALEEQRKSSLAPDHELQLTSSAAAVAAAASVAKAAAAAAKIASIAALHFHQVANQVIHGNAIHPQENEYSVSDVSNNLSDATPASILRGGNGNDAPNSVIFAAREAARRRVEDALAASQHAENLDAIVKAAELAAEAVSQAGRVVAMGKPLPLSALGEGGPENFWRGDLQLAKCSTEKGDKNDIESSKEDCKQSKGPSGLEVSTMVEGSSLPKDIARDVCKNTRVDEGISASHISGEKGVSEKRDSPAPDHTGAGSLASELADAERVQDAHESNQRYLNDDVIKENCIVEVFKDGGCFKGGWYSAKVLSLNDEKALVHFTDVQSNKESDSPREWIPLEGEGNNVPNIRVAHPISGVHFDRTRKRRRAALTEYQWSVGDSVDAWSEDCWREGVITEQNSNDLTTFTVHFPAHGKTLAVKAWHLRPTLTWKNGKWIELLNSRQSAPSQGDTPGGKRLRLRSPVEVDGKQEIPKTVDNVQLGNVDEPNLLPLSSTDKVFNIGSNRGTSKVEAPRMMRSGLQKEGLKFFGVPRPGKKRKFMEVSKHIVSEQSSKINVPNDSSKLSKYLMPRGTGSHGFRNGSKADVKEKQLAESKLKAPSTGKLPGISSLIPSQKDNSTAVSGPGQITSRSHTVKGSISNHARGSSDLNRSGSGSYHEVANDVPVPTQSLPPERNKKASKNGNPERTMKRKLAVAGGRTESAAEDKHLPDLSGPRRSNRKIQPTSRLLEGLQSSLITSKIPSVSHRLQSKGTSTRH